LAESELFGHLRGAFTGADSDRIGRFEKADGGTILLDEITEIDLPLQAKLLRVLQERTFERVGCSHTRTANVRVLTSTNRDLLAEVAQGRFREDLYYRLAVVPLALPSLREREDDVLLLADYFLDRAAQRLDRPRGELLPEAQALFLQYHWPGNVRELENLITRACVLNQGEPITASELRPWLREPEKGPSGWPDTTHFSEMGLPVGTRLDEMERQMIVATLEHFDGHRAKAAQALGIGIRTLSGKLRCYGYAPRTKDFCTRQSTTVPLAANRQTLPMHEAESAAANAPKQVRKTG
jgi:transcriptional regulator with GAF, ATPase, and Fis domain